MGDSQIVVDSASWREAEGLAVLAAEALHGLPHSQWLLPEPQARRDLLSAYLRLVVEHGLADGAVHVSADRHAVAVWWPVVPGLTRPPASYQAWQGQLPEGYRQRLHGLEDAAAARRPKTARYHRLMLLAVRPDHHNRGYGTALLDHGHRLLDGWQDPAYVEAPSRPAIALFGRHGYVPMGPAVNPPDDGPLLWPMWRSPRPVHDRPPAAPT